MKATNKSLLGDEQWKDWQSRTELGLSCREGRRQILEDQERSGEWQLALSQSGMQHKVELLKKSHLK